MGGGCPKVRNIAQNVRCDKFRLYIFVFHYPFIYASLEPISVIPRSDENITNEKMKTIEKQLKTFHVYQCFINLSSIHFLPLHQFLNLPTA